MLRLQKASQPVRQVPAESGSGLARHRPLQGFFQMIEFNGFVFFHVPFFFLTS